MSQISEQTLERYEAWREQADPSDPVPEEFQELAAGAALMRESLRHQAQEVPDMAFAAMWSRIDEQIQRPVSPWSSFWARLTQSWRIPVTAMGGAGALALVWVVLAPKDQGAAPQLRGAMLPEQAPVEVAAQELAASAPSHRDFAARKRAVRKELAMASTELDAQVEAEAEPEVDEGAIPDVNIEKIDFAQGGGRIDKIEHARGTTTVVWIDGTRKKARKPKAMEL